MTVNQSWEANHHDFARKTNDPTGCEVCGFWRAHPWHQLTPTKPFLRKMKSTLSPGTEEP